MTGSVLVRIGRWGRSVALPLIVLVIIPGVIVIVGSRLLIICRRIAVSWWDDCRRVAITIGRVSIGITVARISVIVRTAIIPTKAEAKTQAQSETKTVAAPIVSAAIPPATTAKISSATCISMGISAAIPSSSTKSAPAAANRSSSARALGEA